VLIEEKLSRKHIIDFSYKLDKKSIDLFNIGFHLLNSKNILNIPDEEVTDGPFDFKSKYFPDFEPLRWNDYNTAAKLFEISAKVDPKNILARIFREVSLLKGDMTNGDACYDRDEIIQNLLYIITEYPNHALGHIELANAYSSMSCDDLAHKHIKIALKIGEKSTYINYRAYQIYYSLNCKTEANEILRWANTNHQEILRYSYYRALSARNQHKLSRARDIIMEAFNNGYYTYNIIQSGKNIQDELYYGDSVSEESIALNNEIIIAEKVVLERKMQKKKYLEKYDFRKFHSIQISDYSFTVTYKADNSDTIGSGLNGKKSIRFVDLYCSFIELEELNLLSIPLVFKLGELFRDSDVLYFKNLNLEEVFCNYGD
jgi:hypothetical protein